MYEILKYVYVMLIMIFIFLVACNAEAGEREEITPCNTDFNCPSSLCTFPLKLLKPICTNHQCICQHI
ncbi:Nodule Cysteine-Rich (NCR) secreted peptide [Medicago truncatula]|uniref:Nodule Cysteine-Rich (NCR) secreted peptide n=2 Tax=Medicago truncatula TaxID=3880 RepID=G7IJE8_MEDTR|nr:Nodule Cysteine-Rich (NCR) secreted peptide [Medicago truncatula]